MHTHRRRSARSRPEIGFDQKFTERTRAPELGAVRADGAAGDRERAGIFRSHTNELRAVDEHRDEFVESERSGRDPMRTAGAKEVVLDHIATAKRKSSVDVPLRATR